MIVRIDDVLQHQPPGLRGSHLDTPRPGFVSDVYGFHLSGWALAHASEVERIEIVHENRPIAALALTAKRPDVAARLETADPESEIGFETTIGALDLPTTFEFTVQSVVGGGGAEPLATVRGVRKPLSSSRPPALQPVMITCFGRTGTTWLTWLLECHPEIVAFDPFVRETRVATYWMTVLQQLAAPQSYLAQLDPVNPLVSRWWLGEGDGSERRLGPEVERWLGVDRAQLLAGHCQAQIDRFYLDNTRGGPQARYFVEKFSPLQTIPDLLDEVYAGAREVILVRDFRDQFCSIRAYVAKRNPDGFQWARAGSEAEYVRTTLRDFAAALLRRWRSRRATAHLLHYEDLVREPTETLTALARHLGVDSTPRTIQETLQAACADVPGNRGHLTAPDPTSSVGRWRGALSREVEEAFADSLAPMLEAFGYDPGPAGERA